MSEGEPLQWLPSRTVDRGHNRSCKLNREDMESNVLVMWGGFSNSDLTLSWK